MTHPIWSAPLFEAMARDGTVAIPELQLRLAFRKGALCGAQGPILGSDDLLGDIHRDVVSGRSFDSVMDQVRERLRQILRELLVSPAPMLVLEQHDDTPKLPLPIFIDQLFDDVLTTERTADLVAAAYADRLDCKVVIRKSFRGVDPIGLRTLKLTATADTLRDLVLQSGRGAPRRTAAFWRSFDRMVFRGILSVEGAAGTPEKLMSRFVPHAEAKPRSVVVDAASRGPARPTPTPGRNERDHSAWDSAPPMAPLDLPLHMQAPAAVRVTVPADEDEEVFILGEASMDNPIAFDEYQDCPGDDEDSDEGDDPFGLHADLRARRASYSSTPKAVSNLG